MYKIVVTKPSNEQSLSSSLNANLILVQSLYSNTSSTAKKQTEEMKKKKGKNNETSSFVNILYR